MNTEMSTDQAVNVSGDSSTEIEERLAQISAAMKAKQDGGAVVKADLPEGTACPVDPAERALCEGCQ